MYGQNHINFNYLTISPLIQPMGNIPNYVSGTFIAIVIAVLAFIIYAVSAAADRKSKTTITVIVLVLLGWIITISLLSVDGFYLDYSLPPRLFMFLGVCLISFAVMFAIPKSRAFLGKMPITTLHYLHIVRVPVEMVLWWLAVWSIVPMEMTFEGSNLDIVSGISAPFAAVFLVGARNKNRIGAIIWNLVALALLINIVSRAISYTPYFYDGGDVPANIGVFYFPYVLLPTFVVPAVFFCHLVSLYQLIIKKDQSQF